MRLHSIAVVAPAINSRSGIVQTSKIVLIQTKISEPSIERFNSSGVDRRAGLFEVRTDSNVQAAL